MRALSHLLPSSIVGERRAMLLQAMRYAIAGGVITLLVAASYWAVADLLDIDANVSLAIVFIFFTGVSYVTHGKYSFQDHGSRDRQHVRAMRFFVINLLGFALNQLFVWLFVKHLGGPTWWPIPFIVVFTPLFTFTLHRRWVYA